MSWHTTLYARFSGLAALLLLSSGAGCGGDEWISVGSQTGISLRQCKGGHTDCRTTADSHTIPVGTARQCPAEVTAQLEVDFQVNLSERLCADNRCQANLDAMAVDDAGSVWVLAEVLEPKGYNPPTLWLGHFGPTGEELGAGTIVADVNLQGGSIVYEKALALGPDGRPFVLVYEQTGGPTADDAFSERTWIQEYNADLTRTSLPIPLAELGEAYLAVRADGNLVVAGDLPQNGRRGGLGVVTPQGELTWSRNDLPSVGRGVGIGVAGVAVDAGGAIGVLAVRERDEQGLTQTLGIARYDVEGRLLWDRTFDKLSEGGRWPVLGGDANGNVTVLMVPAPAADPGAVVPPSEQHLWLQSVDSGGVLRWTYLFPDAWNLAMAVAPASGRVFLDLGDLQPAASVAEISPDGTACKRYDFTGVDHIRQLAASPSDQLYFLTQSTVGRFRAIAAE